MLPNEEWLAAQKWLPEVTYEIGEQIVKKIARFQLQGKECPALRLYDEGDKFFGQERWSEAEHTYREALKHEPNDNETQAWLWHVIGRTVERMGRILEAKAAFEKSMELYYNFVPAHRDLGLLYRFHLKDNRSALMCFERAVIIEPTRIPDLYNDIANIHREYGRTQEAERYYRKAIEIDRDCYPALNNLYGLLLQRAIQEAGLTTKENRTALSEAADLMLRLLESAPPQSPETQLAIHNGPIVAEHLRDIATRERDQGLTEAGEQHYLQSILVSEKVGDEQGVYRTRNELGILKQYEGHLDGAGELFGMTLTASQRFGDTYFEMLSWLNLSSVDLLRERWDKSLERSLRALALCERAEWHSHKVDILNNIGVALREKGDGDGATKYLADALQMAQRIDRKDKELLVRANLCEMLAKEADYQTLSAALNYTLKLALSLNDRRVATQLACLGAKAAIQGGRFAVGFDAYQRALLLAGQMGQYFFIASVNQVCQQLADLIMKDERDVAIDFCDHGISFWGERQQPQLVRSYENVKQAVVSQHRPNRSEVLELFMMDLMRTTE